MNLSILTDNSLNYRWIVTNFYYLFSSLINPFCSCRYLSDDFKDSLSQHFKVICRRLRNRGCSKDDICPQCCLIYNWRRPFRNISLSLYSFKLSTLLNTVDQVPIIGSEIKLQKPLNNLNNITEMMTVSIEKIG